MDRVWSCVTVLVTTALAASGLAQSPGVDLQRARQRELASGDCKSSLQEYIRIAGAAEKTDRATAAESLLRSAICYEPFDEGRARKIYERLASEFKGFPEAAESNRRLSLLESGKPSVGLRAAAVDTRLGVDWLPSPDGKTAVSVRSGAGGPGLILHDLASGRERVLIRNDGDTRVVSPIWSPSGRQVAFITATGSGAAQKRIVRRVDVETAEVATVRDQPPGISGALAIRHWTTANEIVATLGEREVLFLPIGEGNPSTTRLPELVQFGDVLPDGSALILLGSEQLIWRDRSSGADHVLTRGYQISSPKVSLDGRLIAFMSNQSGQWALRVAPLSRDPLKLSLELQEVLPGRNRRTRWTADGRLTSEAVIAGDSVYGLRLTGGRARPDQRLERLVHSSSFASVPFISPDGRRIVYAGGDSLNVMNADGSGERSLGRRGLPLAWLSSDEIAFISTVDQLLYAVSLSSGTVRPMGHAPLTDGDTQRMATNNRYSYQYLGSRNEFVVMQFQDGRASFYLKRPGVEMAPWFDLVLSENVPARREDLIRWDLSPDGSRLAYASNPGRLLRVRTVGTNEERLVGPLEGSYIMWTADGRGLVFAAPGGVGGFEVRYYDVATSTSRVLMDGRQLEGVFPADSRWNVFRCALPNDHSFILCPTTMSTTVRHAWENVTLDTVRHRLEIGRE
jgi:hypothetical protein